MAEIVERKSLPRRCIECQELAECDYDTGKACMECDYAMDRFMLIDDNGVEIVDYYPVG